MTTRMAKSRVASVARTLAFQIGAASIVAMTGCSAADDDTMPSSDVPQAKTGAGAKESHKLPASTPVMDQESQFRPVAEIGLQGRVVKFFEPEEGVLVQIEKGIAAEVQIDAEETKLRGSALYAHLTKSPAPQALLDAERRVASHVGVVQWGEGGPTAELPAVILPIDAPDVDGPGLRTTTHWEERDFVARSTFLDGFCVPTDRFWSCTGTLSPRDFVCTGPNFIHKSDVNMMQAGAFAHQSTIGYHGSYSGGTMNWTTQVDQGWYVGWRHTSGVNRTVHSEVTLPFGGSYNHCANYHF